MIVCKDNSWFMFNTTFPPTLLVAIYYLDHYRLNLHLLAIIIIVMVMIILTDKCSRFVINGHWKWCRISCLAGALLCIDSDWGNLWTSAPLPHSYFDQNHYKYYHDQDLTSVSFTFRIQSLLIPASTAANNSQQASRFSSLATMRSRCISSSSSSSLGHSRPSASLSTTNIVDLLSTIIVLF